MKSRRTTAATRLRIYSDPLQHALIAAAVAGPLVPRAGRGVLATAVAPALAIDVDHVLAARSVRVRATTSLATRPRTHSLLTAVVVGAAVTAAAGPLHGWAATGGLVSHLLHDAGDRAAPTPLLWPLRPARQIGRRRQVAGTAALALASAAVSGAWAAAGRRRSSSAGAGDGAGTARPRTG